MPSIDGNGEAKSIEEEEKERTSCGEGGKKAIRTVTEDAALPVSVSPEPLSTLYTVE